MRKTASQISDEVLEKVADSEEWLKRQQRRSREFGEQLFDWDKALDSGMLRRGKKKKKAVQG